VQRPVMTNSLTTLERSRKMIKRKAVSVLVGIGFLVPLVGAQPPDTLWTAAYGGGNTERGFSIDETEDGGFIAVGVTNSFGAGDFDVWLIRVDENGDSLWSHTFGGADEDYGYCVRQTDDGGFIIAGFTRSFGSGSKDVWLIKTRSTGIEEWSHTFGGAGDDVARSVCQTVDGGYALAGFINGCESVWVIKTDENGIEEWNQTFGGASTEEATCIRQTADHGFIIAGNTLSFGSGGYDMWLVKTDSVGNEEWNGAYGGDGWDEAYCVYQTSDLGYIASGVTRPQIGPFDIFLVKADSLGNEEWSATFGDADDEHGNSVIQTADGGYLVAGDNGDAWLLKLNGAGDLQWETANGGANGDEGRCVLQTRDGDYAVAGITASFGAGASDLWLIRLEGELYMTLTPLNPPIVIPSYGGNFEYLMSLINNTITPSTFDVWTDVTLPSGMVYGPIVLREDISLPAHTTLSRQLRQIVGPGAPPGDYSFNGYMGVYGGEIWSTDSFSFTKEGGDTGSNQDYPFDYPDENMLSSETSAIPKVATPREFSVSAYPNPFNPATEVSYELPEAAAISVGIYNILGQHIVTLVDGYEFSGKKTVVWNGTDRFGEKVSSGLYLLRAVARGISGNMYVQHEKLLLTE